ncbi:hypothetical protein [Leptospira tipperaryensis]|uniref:hypothetical protein n=1 Tax=Leptospira tipperaryensis TaxID=2564040 RepID=UPI00156BAF78|nr:hypothetical protein [Leptospira tipperaryensis]
METTKDLRDYLFWEVEETLKKFEYDFQVSPEPIQVLRHTYALEIVSKVFATLEKK